MIGWFWNRWMAKNDGAERAEGLEEHLFFATHTQLKELLAQQISPKLESQKLAYNGGYNWYGPWEEHCRRVLQVYLLKGASAIFRWGLCFDFLPVLSGDGRTFRYQRTEKSVGLQLATWPPDHWEGGRICRFTMIGRDLRDVEGQLLRAFREAQNLFEPWFRQTAGLTGALAEAARQAEEPRNFSWPRPGYVLAFLLVANGCLEEGERALTAYFAESEISGKAIPPEIQEKLFQKLRSCLSL